MSKPVPCIVCHTELSDIGSGSSNHASGGNAFRTMGQYGSTVFDPMDGSYLEVNICDKCIVSAAKNGEVLLGQQYRHIKSHVKPWRAT